MGANLLIDCGPDMLVAAKAMTRRELALGALRLATAGTSLVLGACSSRGMLRYKMIVEVDTPDGVRIGETGREVMRQPVSFLDYGKAGLVMGEAVAVDLPGAQTLFALLKGENGDVDYAGRHVPQQNLGFGQDTSPVTVPVVIWPHPPVPPKQRWLHNYPMLVRFQELNDPKSVERIDKAHLEAVFGAGIALKRITVAVTTDPVVMDIRRRLPWLSRYPEPSLDRDHGPRDLSPAATILHGDFIREMSR